MTPDEVLASLRKEFASTGCIREIKITSPLHVSIEFVSPLASPRRVHECDKIRNSGFRLLHNPRGFWTLHASFAGRETWSDCAVACPFCGEELPP